MFEFVNYTPADLPTLSTESVENELRLISIWRHINSITPRGVDYLDAVVAELLARR